MLCNGTKWATVQLLQKDKSKGVMFQTPELANTSAVGEVLSKYGMNYISYSPTL